MLGSLQPFARSHPWSRIGLTIAAPLAALAALIAAITTMVLVVESRLDRYATSPSVAPSLPEACPPMTQSQTGVDDCDLYFAALGTYRRCEVLSAQTRDAVGEAMHEVKAMLAIGPCRDGDVACAERLPAVNLACRQAAKAVRHAVEAIGCPL